MHIAYIVQATHWRDGHKAECAALAAAYKKRLEEEAAEEARLDKEIEEEARAEREREAKEKEAKESEEAKRKEGLAVQQRAGAESDVGQGNAQHQSQAAPAAPTTAPTTAVLAAAPAAAAATVLPSPSSASPSSLDLYDLD